MTAIDVLSPARIRAVEIARTWIGTPYHAQASMKGAGCDCLGLVRGVWRELYGRDAETPPPYSPDWAEANGCEAMLEAAARHLGPLPAGEFGAGDVLIFRFRRGLVAKHAAIVASTHTMVHAAEGAPACEVPLSPWWRRRIAAAFRFPEV